MVAQHNSIFQELAVFLASLSPKRVLAFKASQKAQERVSFLLAKNRETGLSVEENAEMERFMTFEHIVRLAKAKALQRLNQK